MDVLQEMERWQGNFTEAGGREIVGILHVFSDDIELEYERQAANIRLCSLLCIAFRSEYS